MSPQQAQTRHAMSTSTKEVPLKQWLAEQAQRIGISLTQAEGLFKRGGIAPKSIRRVNKRVILVQP